MDTTQLVIVIVSLTLTALLVILGVQVYFILKEIRGSVHKVNKMLDDMGKVSGTVTNTMVNMGGFFNGLKTGLSAIATLKGKGESHE